MVMVDNSCVVRVVVRIEVDVKLGPVADVDSGAAVAEDMAESLETGE